MAYLKDIPRPMCDYCKRSRATKTLVNSRNAQIGDYCGPCGKRKLAEFERAERGEDAKGSSR